MSNASIVSDPDPSGEPAQGPLVGVRVLDFTRVLSGPHCTRMLADMGADVVKVEPPEGDLTRYANPRANGMSSYFVQQNTGKRNVSLDLDHPAAVELVLRLVEHADVVVENFRPGVMERLGLGYPALSARCPRLVYASISGYGQTGPWVNRRAFAPVVGAESGFTRMQGEVRGNQFANDPFSHADVYTALEATSAILAALFQRGRTGRGQSIDVSMAQTMLYVNEHIHDQLWDGPIDPEWIRSFEPHGYPVLQAANGVEVIVSGHPADRGSFARFARVMHLEHLLDDPRFVDVDARRRHLPELVEEMRVWARTMADPVAIEEALAAEGFATGALRSVREIAATDWATDRGSITRVSDRGAGSINVPEVPWRFSDAAAAVQGHPRYRGEDNREVLVELLGLTAAEVDALEASGALSSRIPSS